MKYLLLLINLIFFISYSEAQPPGGGTYLLPNDKHWVPIWYDNFKNRIYYNGISSASPGPGLSMLDHIQNRGWLWQNEAPWDHGEPQVYKSANVRLEPTGLEITAKIEFTAAANCTKCSILKDHFYSSGAITSWDGYNHDHLPKFGYIEVGMKVPDGYGLFPAFWIWSPSPSLIKDDESMTFEFVPGSKQTCKEFQAYGTIHDKYMVTNNLAWDDAPQGCDPQFSVITENIMFINDYTTFHRYGFEWTPSKIIWYVDGNPIRLAPNPNKILKDPSSIILNLALYDWVEASVHWDNGAYKYDFNTDTPKYLTTGVGTGNHKMTIEYVSYFRLNFDCNHSWTAISTNLNMYDNKVKNNINTFGPVSIPNGYAKNIWRASTIIELADGFEVPLGSELFLDVDECY